MMEIKSGWSGDRRWLKWQFVVVRMVITVDVNNGEIGE